MPKYRLVALTALFVSICQLFSWAHPGSGIAVDRQGQVYFTDTGGAVWKIDTRGNLRQINDLGYHWLAFDETGHFSAADFRDLQTPSEDVQKIIPEGAAPVIVLSSDYPMAAGRQGDLYYPRFRSSPPLEVVRRTADGKSSVLASVPAAANGSPLQWLNGIAVGPDGFVYFTENDAIRKVSPRGDLSTVAYPVKVPACSPFPLPDSIPKPYLRGLAVGVDEALYVAATGCRCVLKITRDGQTRALLRASEPWSPTGVALLGEDVHVLEYLHTAGDDRRAWTPRVRRLSRDGAVNTLATVTR